MKEYIFYTFEGYTESPNRESVENLQILGFEKAENKQSAFNSLLKNNAWIKRTGFSINSIKSKQVLTNDNELFSIQNMFVKYLSNSNDPREILKSVLLELGLNEGIATLIAIEAGGSQCKVTKTYLRKVKIPNEIFHKVYEAIRYFYFELV